MGGREAMAFPGASGLAGIDGFGAVAVPGVAGFAIVPAIVPAAPIPALASSVWRPAPRGKFDLRLAPPMVLDSKSARWS
jgi:hypothetical protein